MTYSLSDLALHLRRVVALNFQTPLWVTAEIAQVSLARGHYFLELVQKEASTAAADLTAQASAVLWAGDYRRLRHTLGAATLDPVLREGLLVKMQVRVDFHERHGLKLVIVDLDPEYTFGQVQRQRLETLARLEAAGLLFANRGLAIRPVLQRVAVISAEGAAGFQDFRAHLTQNPFGYGFDCQLFVSSVQGLAVAEEMLTALAAVAERAGEFDCVVVVRGGGARLDLAAFDGWEVCAAAAEMPLPLFTGIGHDADETLLDRVAYAALKTPTAAADFLIQHNLFFENRLLALAAEAQAAGRYFLQTQFLKTATLESNLHWTGAERLRRAERQLSDWEIDLPRLARQALQNAEARLAQATALCQALHPEAVLRRGYSLTLKDGKAIKQVSEVTAGEALETRLAEGSIWSLAQ